MHTHCIDKKIEGPAAVAGHFAPQHRKVGDDDAWLFNLPGPRLFDMQGASQVMGSQLLLTVTQAAYSINAVDGTHVVTLSLLSQPFDVRRLDLMEQPQTYVTPIACLDVCLLNGSSARLVGNGLAMVLCSGGVPVGVRFGKAAFHAAVETAAAVAACVITVGVAR